MWRSKARSLAAALALSAGIVAACACTPEPAAATVRGQGPLAANGFASPWCEDPGIVARLSPAARSNCAASGVAASPVPIGNYQFDVHIDTGPLGVGGTTFAIAIQDLVLTPLWTALVWLVHALIVALEWCYSLDLLGGGPLRQIGEALRSAQAMFTEPWLALALAIAAVGLAFDGIVRRRVADSLGGAALTAAMIAGGLWLIADPAGTVGAVSRTVNEASLGTLAAIDSGTPDHAERSFTSALDGVFRTTVTAPWCYLEFGNVGWCSDPARVDPRVRAVAARIAAADRAAAGCGSTPASASGPLCVQPDARGAAVLRTEANLLTSARTNGELFLALPANGPKRNSINDPDSLLRVICETADATACRGPSASEAEFRTQSGTWPRAGGLLFVAIGTAATLALLGFIGARLLAAALLSVLYLLLAPVVVIAPAFGDRGRAAFRAWSARLLGALVAKLVYSVLLGVVLLMLRILLSLDALGWWTQWLLIAAFWWIVFLNRHQLLGHVFGEQHRSRTRLPSPAAGRSLVRLARRPGRAMAAAAGTVLDRARELPPRGEPDAARSRPSRVAEPAVDPAGASRATAPAPAPAPIAPETATSALDDQVQRMIADDHMLATPLPRTSANDPGNGDCETRRQRLSDQLAVARQSGDTRRAVSLSARLRRLDTVIADAGSSGSSEATTPAPPVVSSAGDAQAIQREHYARELDRQALLPSRGRRDSATGEARDYLALAQLAHVSQAEYRSMPVPEQRRVRLQIDGELDKRREWLAVVHEEHAGDQRHDGRPIPRSPRQRQFTREEFEQLLE